MKKLIFCVAAVLAALIGTASCSKEDNPVGNSKTIAIFMPTHTHVARWAEDKAALEEALKSSASIKYKFFMVEEDSLGAIQQAGQIQQAITDGYKTLIILPVDYAVLNKLGALNQASDCNVICHDRLIMDNPNIDYFSTCNLEGVGALQAECLIHTFRVSGKSSMTLEMLAGPASDFNAERFYNGAYELLKPLIDGDSLIVLSGRKTFSEVSIGQWSAKAAEDTMATILSTYYKDTIPDLILAANDQCASGSIAALEQHIPGLTKYPAITGQDNTADAQANILAGKQTMTVDKNINNMCLCTALVAQAFVNGTTPLQHGTQNNGATDVAVIKSDPQSVYSWNLQEQ